MESNKLINYAIWATVIGGVLFFVYKKFGSSGDSNSRTSRSKTGGSWTIDEIGKKYPNWERKASSSGNGEYYAKNFWTLNADGTKFKEMWLIFYSNGTWKIYTRSTPENFVSGGNFTRPTALEVTDGYNKGNTFKTNSLANSVSKVLNQGVSELPTN